MGKFPYHVRILTPSFPLNVIHYRMKYEDIVIFVNIYASSNSLYVVELKGEERSSLHYMTKLLLLLQSAGEQSRADW